MLVQPLTGIRPRRRRVGTQGQQVGSPGEQPRQRRGAVGAAAAAAWDTGMPDDRHAAGRRRNRQRVHRLPGSPGPAGQGRQAGNIATEADLAVLANFVVNSWAGALTRARAAKIKEPLQTFFDTVFGVVLR
jgi:hypothetical protein